MTRGWMGARGQFDAGDEDIPDPLIGNNILAESSGEEDDGGDSDPEHGGGK